MTEVMVAPFTRLGESLRSVTVSVRGSVTIAGDTGIC